MTSGRKWVSLAGRLMVIVAMLHYVLIILTFWRGMQPSLSGLLDRFARTLESISVTLKMAAALSPETSESTNNLQCNNPKHNLNNVQFNILNTYIS